jgi:D-alanyl-D-alanine carboxypeptidase
MELRCRVLHLKKPVFFLILFCICFSSYSADKVTSQSSAAVAQRIGCFIDTLMNKYSIPGAAVGVWRNDTSEALLIKGKSDISNNRPMDRGSLVRIASITKTFVASVALELIDEGKLSLDDTLKKFLPLAPGANRIIIRELCSHTSGIHDVIEDTSSSCGFVNHPKMHFSKQNFLDCIQQTKGDFEPGTKSSYSNTGYILLGMIIEKVTGHSLEQEIHNRLLNPLHLRQTFFCGDSTFSRRYCHGYMLDTVSRQMKDVSFIDPSGVWAAGAMVSTLDDLKKWAVLLTNGTFLRPQTQRMRLTFSQGWDDCSRYGLGIMKIGAYIGHSGGIFGYNTGMFYDPEKHRTLIIIYNNCNYVDGHITETILGISRILNNRDTL